MAAVVRWEKFVYSKITEVRMMDWWVFRHERRYKAIMQMVDEGDAVMVDDTKGRVCHSIASNSAEALSLGGLSAASVRVEVMDWCSVDTMHRHSFHMSKAYSR